jgi:hypothetical protein
MFRFSIRSGSEQVEGFCHPAPTGCVDTKMLWKGEEVAMVETVLESPEGDSIRGKGVKEKEEMKEENKRG